MNITLHVVEPSAPYTTTSSSSQSPQEQHDARKCSACLRAGVQTVVASAEQQHQFVLGSPIVNNSPSSSSRAARRRGDDDDAFFAIALEEDAVFSSPLRGCGGGRSGDDGDDGLVETSLRWILFLDRSDEVHTTNSNKSQMLLLPGADPLPPTQTSVPAYSFSRASSAEAAAILLAPVVTPPYQKRPLVLVGNSTATRETTSTDNYHSNNNDDRSRSTSMLDALADAETEAMLEATAQALSELADVCDVSECDRPLFVIQGQCITLSGNIYYVQETEPSGCMVRICDTTQLALARAITRPMVLNVSPLRSSVASASVSPPSALRLRPPNVLLRRSDTATPTRPVRMNQSNNNDGVGENSRLVDAGTSPIIVMTTTTDNNKSTTNNNSSSSASRVYSTATIQTSTATSPLHLEEDDIMGGGGGTTTCDDDGGGKTPGPLEKESWTQRYRAVQRKWEMRFGTATTPEGVVNLVLQLALACNSLQAINNDVAAFLISRKKDLILHRHPSATSSSLASSSSMEISSALAASPLLYAPFHGSNDGSRNSSGNAETLLPAVVLVMHRESDQVCLALELLGIKVTETWFCLSAGAVYVATSPTSRIELQRHALSRGFVVINHEEKRVTRIDDHCVLDDLHRLLEWHNEQVTNAVRALESRVDWQFVMDVWGSNLADLVRDVRLEMDNVVGSSVEASNSALHEVEAALDDFRHRIRSGSSHGSYNNNEEEDDGTAAYNNNTVVVDVDVGGGGAPSTMMKEHLARVLSNFSKALAHEVAGKADAKAHHDILYMWRVFEQLGSAYEQVVSQVAAFRERLLTAKLESGEIHNHTFRSTYQECMARIRGSTLATPLEQLRSVFQRLVSAAQEEDVFSGAPVAELTMSDCRSFSDFIVLVCGDGTVLL